MKNKRGYTLIELIIAVGLFALIMMLASGAYLVMIGINRQVQSVATGIDNLAFALETMTRTIRTGTNYSCNNSGDCNNGGTTFSVRNASGVTTSYALSGGVITQDGVALTDSSVTVSSLVFYASGTGKPPGDYAQSRVTIIVSGTVPSGPGETEPFNVETGATMRGSDL
ncbi:prepilin-type N-terminal cleavage/methylation domain-containing protein [Candidatus Kaiserbacteria bacterium]|nr:prepilin-type N-terminal cleavage/methylation domain-containing protein [Candidatus Kaiserbacteria bacterium]